MKWNQEVAPGRIGMVAVFGAALALVMVSSPASALGVVGEQQAKLLAGDPGFGDRFGNGAAVSGDTLLVGAPGNDDAGTDSGSAYVYVRSGSVWTQQAKLVAAGASAQQDFGFVVDIDGDIAVVGAPAETPFTGNGAAYVFARSGSVWTQQAKLIAGDGVVNDRFGEAVAISGGTVVVGALSHDIPGVPGIGHGACYVFQQTGGSWSQQAKLVASDAFDLSVFGGAVAIDGDSVAIGAVNSPGPGFSRGAVYVFVRQDGTWTEQARLSDLGTTVTDGFGHAVSIDRDTLAIGIPFTDDGFNQSGSLQVYTRSGTAWALQATLTADDPELSATLGSSLVVRDEVLVAGAPGAGSAAGSAYVFVRSGASWDFATKLLGVGGLPGDNLGFSVDLDGSTVGLGGPASFGGAGPGPGAAWVFTLEPTPWTDLGAGLAGTAGVPVFSASGSLVAGEAVTFSLDSAAPFAPATLVVGLGELNAPFKGGTLVPTPDVLLGLVTDGLGEVTFGAIWPAGFPALTTVVFQFWLVDAVGPQGFSASNGFLGVTP